MKQVFRSSSIKKIVRYLLEVPHGKNRSSVISRYGVAVVGVLVAFGIRYLLNPVLGFHSPFVLFLPAILIAAWHGGVGPGSLAILGTFLLTDYFFVPPQNQWSPFRLPQIITAVTYLFSTIVVLKLMNSVQRESERVLATEELLRTTTEGANIDLWSWDVVNDIVDCPLLRERFGLPTSEVTLQTFLNYVHPDDRAWVKKEAERCSREGAEFDVEYRTIWHDGSIHWRYSKGRPSHAGDGFRLNGMSMDITKRKKGEEALRRSEQLLRITTEGARIGLWSWDIGSDIVNWNSIEYQQFGLPENAEINLSDFMNCIHPDDRAKVQAAIEKCLSNGDELNIEHRILRTDGAVRWNQCKGQISYANGRAISLNGMSLDITERREIEETLRREAELLDLAQVLVFDLEDRILFWNRGAEKLYGWSKEEAIGKNCHDLLRTKFSAPLENIKEELFRKNYWEGELTHFRKNGDEILVASHWVVYKDAENRPVAILQSDNNITKLKKTEQALQEAKNALGKHADQLEQRVSRRTEQLQQSVKDMESFCYTIAHDLKAPLRALSGFSHSLETEHATQLDETGREHCARINASANRMSQLISDLLAYGRLTHRKLPTRSVDLGKEIEKVLERAALQIEERHAEIAVDRPLPKVCGDAPMLDQVLENLITNAVKFVPKERQPHVHIFAERYKRTVRLCVEDNGIGIPPQYRKQIFRPFERLHAAAPYPGTGIGLAIVQKGIEKMGGHVGVESAPKEGSRFWIELPEQCGKRPVE